MAKILLVDDDRSIHLALKAILAQSKHEMVSAMDGMQGLMMARQIEPDMIILDVNMPAGGGAGVFERMHVIVHTASIPILIYSALSREEIAAKIPGAAQSRVAVLVKPASAEAILDSVQSLLAQP